MTDKQNRSIDKELEAMQEAATAEQAERDEYYRAHGLGKDWECYDNCTDDKGWQYELYA